MTLPARFIRKASLVLLALATAASARAQTNEPAPRMPPPPPNNAATAPTNAPGPAPTSAVAPAPAGAPATASVKPKIGIMKFEVSKSLDPTLSNLLYAVLTKQVVKSGRFIVVDWEQIDRVL